MLWFNWSDKYYSIAFYTCIHYSRWAVPVDWQEHSYWLSWRCPIGSSRGRSLEKASSAKYSESRFLAVYLLSRLGAALKHPNVTARLFIRICRIQPHQFFCVGKGPLVWELSFQFVWFHPFSYLIILFIFLIRPHCFCLIFLLSTVQLVPVCRSPSAEKGISRVVLSLRALLQPAANRTLDLGPALLILLRPGLNAGGFISRLLAGSTVEHQRRHVRLSLWGMYLVKSALWKGEKINALSLWMRNCRAPLVLYPSAELRKAPSQERVSGLEMLYIWSVCAPCSHVPVASTGSGFSRNWSLRSLFWGRLASFFWTNIILKRSVFPPETAVMGDSMWRYYLGVLFIACKVNLSRALIMESIYWNTTNTK